MIRMVHDESGHGPHRLHTDSNASFDMCFAPNPIGSMYAIYGNIYHPYTPNVSIYTIHGSYMGTNIDPAF